MDSTGFNYVLTQFGIAGVLLVVLVLALYQLGSDLAKLRTDLQQQVARDLLNKRFDAYGRLWSTLKPLAIYSDEVLSPPKVQHLAEALTHWYFSADGGMFLTTNAREFYFALQETLQAAADLKGWKCIRRPEDVERRFRDFLGSIPMPQGFSLNRLAHPETLDATQWRQVCKAVAVAMRALPSTGGSDVNDTVFATVQQVSSVLRTVLAHELHTRLELRVPPL
ncbi:hypothetical protein OOT46_25340 [Aquabacterium sp. A7-Y]|uniref:hypothetical protein n=1 Tax=Aquabacterium sp. A7-Y TaxID=1349605 RepID=UPI00223E593B|nr:hypothetical protein [Aquabacterium sp. A7-Y]MCW7541142.1 hypothetical protein [Aquabacterium sp. A7-Y]